MENATQYLGQSIIFGHRMWTHGWHGKVLCVSDNGNCVQIECADKTNWFAVADLTVMEVMSSEPAEPVALVPDEAPATNLDRVREMAQQLGQAQEIANRPV